MTFPSDKFEINYRWDGTQHIHNSNNFWKAIENASQKYLFEDFKDWKLWIRLVSEEKFFKNFYWGILKVIQIVINLNYRQFSLFFLLFIELLYLVFKLRGNKNNYWILNAHEFPHNYFLSFSLKDKED